MGREVDGAERRERGQAVLRHYGINSTARRESGAVRVWKVDTLKAGDPGDAELGLESGEPGPFRVRPNRLSLLGRNLWWRTKRRGCYMVLISPFGTGVEVGNSDAAKTVGSE